MWRESRDRCVEAAERQYGRQTREHVAALARHTEACRLIIDEHARNVQEYTAMCAAMREAAQKLREDADR